MGIRQMVGERDILARKMMLLFNWPFYNSWLIEKDIFPVHDYITKNTNFDPSTLVFSFGFFLLFILYNLIRHKKFEKS